jgi:hypothetical protein
MSDELKLGSIKKIITVSTGLTSEGARNCEHRVNQLLGAGWILLEIQKNDYYGEFKANNTYITYHLGHVDPKAKTFDGSEDIDENTTQ